MHIFGAPPAHDALCGGTMVPISVRYVPDLKRVYVEPSSDISRGLGGCASLTQIWETLPHEDSPLYAVDPTTNAVSDVPTGTWLLTTDLYIEHGITLSVVEVEQGGDADEVRLLSNSEAFVNLRGNGGSLAFENTHVLSWDDAIGGPDENISDGRSYVSCLSEIATAESLSLSCDGRAEATIGECRMDIRKSEMAYLGYDADESWGLSSIVRGFCKDKSNPEMFDNVVSVRGTIVDSDLHHNYHGYYALGSRGGAWTGNAVHDNVGDGFHAREYSRNLTIAGNDVRDNGNHGIVGAEWCSDLTILENIVVNNKIGISLRGMGDRAIVQRNYVEACSEAGIAMQESSHGVISGNMLLQNAINLRVSSGSTGNLFDSNIIRGGTEYQISLYDGKDALVHRDSGRPNNNVLCRNKLEGPRRANGGVHIANADGIQFVENLIFDGPWHFGIENSESFVFSGNLGYHRVEVSLDSESCVDPLSDYYGVDTAVCESSNVVLYQPSGFSSGSGSGSGSTHIVKPAIVADTLRLMGSFSSVAKSSSSSFVSSSSAKKVFGEISKPFPWLFLSAVNSDVDTVLAARAAHFDAKVDVADAVVVVDGENVLLVDDGHTGRDAINARDTVRETSLFNYFWCAAALVVVCLLAWFIRQARKELARNMPLPRAGKVRHVTFA